MGNVSIVKTGDVSIGVTPEEKAMLLQGSGMNAAQARCWIDYGDEKVSDANLPPVDGEHVASGSLLAPQAAKGPYDDVANKPVKRIDTTPRQMEIKEETEY